MTRSLSVETEGSITDDLTKQPSSYNNPICSITMTNIPEHSVVEFILNSYTCTNWCRCNSCFNVRVRQGLGYPMSTSLSNTSKYVYTKAADILIETYSTSVIKFNITYRGKYKYM